jgi:hypothetical protein
VGRAAPQPPARGPARGRAVAAAFGGPLWGVPPPNPLPKPALGFYAYTATVPWIFTCMRPSPGVVFWQSLGFYAYTATIPWIFACVRPSPRVVFWPSLGFYAYTATVPWIFACVRPSPGVVFWPSLGLFAHVEGVLWPFASVRQSSRVVSRAVAVRARGKPSREKAKCLPYWPGAGEVLPPGPQLSGRSAPSVRRSCVCAARRRIGRARRNPDSRKVRPYTSCG